jgi:hypothetical protein
VSSIFLSSRVGEAGFLYGSLAVSILALFLIVGKAAENGLGLLQISGQRNLALADGGGPFFTLMLAYKATVLLIYFRRVRESAAAARKMIPHIVVACGFDLLLGTRSGVIFSLIIPVLLAQHYLGARIDLRKLVVPVVVIMLLLVPLYRSLTRDVGFERNRGLTSEQVVQKNFAQLPQMLFGGNEISVLDGSIDVVKNYGTRFDYLGGLTIYQSPIALVPRSVYGDDKPYGGASTIYTNTLYPANYHRERSELLTSFVGELYMNYSWSGVIIGFGILGVFLAGLSRWTFDQSGNAISETRLLIYGIVLGRFLNLLRGDLFGFVSQTFNVLVMIALVLLVMRVATLLAGQRQPRAVPY